MKTQAGARARVLTMSWYAGDRKDAGELIRFDSLTSLFGDKFDVRRIVIDEDTLTDDSAPADVPPFRSRTLAYKMKHIDYLFATSVGSAIEAHRLGRNRKLREWVDSVIEEYAPDVIWVNQPFMFSLVPSAVRGRVILDTHNVNSARLRRIAEASRTAPRLIAKIQSSITEKYERSFSSAARIVAVSKSDRALLVDRMGDECADRVVVLPNGATLDLSAKSPDAIDPEGTPRLMFLGSLGYSANVAALRRLADWVRGTDLRFVLSVVGSGSPDEARAICDTDERFAFVGRVDDPREAMRHHDALIAPHDQGGGSRIKVIEAMASRLPVVASEVAVEGLGLEAGREYVRVESASGFADAIQRCLRDRKLVQSITENAWIVAGTMQWSAVAGSAVKLIQTVRNDAERERLDIGQ